MDVDLDDTLVKLEGENSILGRSIVVHANADDLGKGGNAESLATGNAGGREACCIIEELVYECEWNRADF